MGRGGALNRRRKGEGGGRLKLRRASSRSLRSGPACGLTSTALFTHQPGNGGGSDSLVRRAWDRRDLLQPHAIRAPHGQLQRGAGCEIRPRRLAPPLPGVSGARTGPESGTSRRSSPAGPETRHHGFCRCCGVDPRVAWGDRCDRRRALASADRWLDWRGDSPTHLP